MTTTGRPVRSNPSLRHCGLYRPGHEVHYIQAKLSFEDTDSRPAGRLLEVGDDGVLLVETDNGVQRLWNHDPAGIRAIWKRMGDEVELRAKGMLSLVGKGGNSYFCVANPDDHVPCPLRP